jgi:hypothetical protein
MTTRQLIYDAIEEQQRIIDSVCERLRADTAKRLSHAPAFGVDLVKLGQSDADRIGAAVLSTLKSSVPGPWPEQEPRVKCWLDGTVLRAMFTMQPGPAADQLARAGVDVRYADGTPYVPMDLEMVITAQETEP